MLFQSEYRCINCFSKLNSEETACKCGFDEKNYKPKHYQLMPGTILNGTYLIGSVLGEGGFGITYSAYDINLELKYAIKEYFLSEYGTRDVRKSNRIFVLQNDTYKLFDKNLDRFLNEAKTLARFNNEEGIVSVHHFFKENDTAYFVMDLASGQNLREYVKKKGRMSIHEIIKYFIPIMETLDKVHGEGLIHRDISPDNIIITSNDKIKLIDFGAARDIDNNKSISVIYKEGYAPPEQYNSRGKQGSWTDVFGLSATMYYCLAGVAPIGAVERLMGTQMRSVHEIDNSCSESVSKVIMRGLELDVSKRYTSVEELVSALKKAYEENRTKFYNKSVENEKTEDMVGTSDLSAAIESWLDGDNNEYRVELGISGANQKNKYVYKYFYLAMANIGDIVEFGDFHGMNKWQVLYKSKSHITLISECAIGKIRFNKKNEYCTWNNSTLRVWLNGVYYNTAFNEEEKKLILDTTIKSLKNKVYILSVKEMEYLIRNIYDRRSHFVDGAKACNRQVLFHKFWQLIFHNPRHLVFHSLRHFIFHTYLCSLGLPGMAAHYY